MVHLAIHWAIWLASAFFVLWVGYGIVIVVLSAIAALFSDKPAFDGNAVAVLHRGPDNPAAGSYRNPPEHRDRHTLKSRTGSPNSATSKS